MDFKHLSDIDWSTVANATPFISATVQGKPSPMTTRLIEAIVIAAATILLGYIFMVPSLSSDIKKNTDLITYKLDTLVINQNDLKNGQIEIAKAVNDIDHREQLHDLQQQNEINQLKNKVKE